ncbi:alpha/beta hydrolase [Hydrocarboniphaga sp.]|uniref:alpha/beta hydrolase n=1 Tax=Hydrocarboniphaga sp. TaxID=2033016 RepID=UPI003D0FF429
MKTCRRVTALLAALWLCSAPALAADAACSAFGNPPQATSNGLSALSYALTRCSGGALLDGYIDSNGTPRRACFWDNPAATAERPLPLLIYLQASLAPLDTQIGKTGLLDARLSADLSGDAAKRGFLLLAPLPRYTRHYYPLPNGFSLGFDVWYRQFGRSERSVDGVRYPVNVDFATIDHYIAQLVATQRVDPQRIVLLGYSNGASTAIAYAQNRANIAAAAVYSAPDPYAFLDDACPQQPVTAAPASIAELQVTRRDAPIFHLHRDCDVYGSCPNAQRLGARIAGSASALWREQIIDRDQQPVDACDAACGSNADGSPWNLKARITGSHNHNSWPDAWDDRLIGFLREHPLPAP